MPDQQEVAVLGAGFLGSCLALELARRGRRVVLFDRADEPITGAGLNNEGKLHLGYLWAKDRSMGTAELVASGSLRFAHLLRRWIGAAVDDLPFGQPFHYAMPGASMVTEADLKAHFERIDAVLDRQRAAARTEGVADCDLRRVAAEPHAAWLPPGEVDGMFDAHRVRAAARTREVSVDPHAVAAAVRSAVLSTPTIRFRGGTEVVSVTGAPDRFRVEAESGESIGPYREVVNALWDGRLRIDAGLGLTPPRQWLWRVKFGLRLRASLAAVGVPNVTFLVGPFGDISDYGNGSALLSWYPAGLRGTSTLATPPAEWSRLDAERRECVRRGTVDGLMSFCPAVGRLPDQAIDHADVVGGTIYALGETDIDDPASGLHARTNPGIRSVGGYLSVDPGKYCLVPLMAMLAADRVTGEMGR